MKARLSMRMFATHRAQWACWMAVVRDVMVTAARRAIMPITTINSTSVKAFRRRYAAEIEDLLETVYRAFPADETKNVANPGSGDTEIAHRQAVERLHDASWEDSMRRHLH